MLAEGFKTQPNIVRYILASAYRNCDPGEVCPVGGVNPSAASEEFCMCNPSTFPCIGIFTETSGPLPEAVMLAHEIGHTLGVYPHESQSGYIMSTSIDVKEEYVWSERSRSLINAHDNDCLERK